MPTPLPLRRCLIITLSPFSPAAAAIFIDFTLFHFAIVFADIAAADIISLFSHCQYFRFSFFTIFDDAFDY
jgi:hypothetical protein